MAHGLEEELFLVQYIGRFLAAFRVIANPWVQNVPHGRDWDFGYSRVVLDQLEDLDLERSELIDVLVRNVIVIHIEVDARQESGFGQWTTEADDLIGLATVPVEKKLDGMFFLLNLLFIWWRVSLDAVLDTLTGAETRDLSPRHVEMLSPESAEHTLFDFAGICHCVQPVFELALECEAVGCCLVRTLGGIFLEQNTAIWGRRTC